MLSTDNNAASQVLDGFKAWEAESCRLHSDVASVFDLACGMLREDSGWILVAVAPAKDYNREETNALTLGACRALRGINVPNGFYVTRKLESRSTVLDIRHVRIERFGEGADGRECRIRKCEETPSRRCHSPECNWLLFSTRQISS